MVRENVRFSKGNFTSDGVYFYSMLETSQALQQKVDDGSVAFTYPLDTALGAAVKELHWDGVYFWSLEAKAGGLIIRKWAIDSFICKQQQKFDFNNDATHTYDADAFAVEHYRLTVGVNDNGSGGYTTGLSSIHISDTSILDSGDILTFVRRGTSSANRINTIFVEQKQVQSVSSATQVVLTSAMTGNPHGDNKGFRGPNVDIDLLGGSHPPTPDLVYVTKFLWIANKNSPSVTGTPALYKRRSANGNSVVEFSGTQYSNIGGMDFYVKYDQGTGLDDDDTTPYNTTIDNDTDAGGDQTYLLLARDSILLFFNVSTNVVDRSMVMNNVKVNTIDIWPVFDMVVLGVEPNVVIYRLQQGTTYKNTSLVLTDESWGSQFNYEKQLIRRVVSSISIVADPSIIPADGNSTSTITAVLKDQFNSDVPSGKAVNWSDDAGGDGGLDSAQTFTDSFGEATNQFSAGVNEKDVKITASVVNGLIS